MLQRLPDILRELGTQAASEHRGWLCSRASTYPREQQGGSLIPNPPVQVLRVGLASNNQAVYRGPLALAFS